MATLRRKGFTLIELLIVVAIVALFTLLGIFIYQQQLIKARDAKRKSDLDNIQTVLEDYLNDNLCYPDELICDSPFAPYVSNLPCDPKNNLYHNYFYSYDEAEPCKSWYKIYSRLENQSDPIIEEKDCVTGCGPSGNYNYWVSSANVADPSQLPGESWWEPIPGASPPPGGSGAPSAGPSAGPSADPSADPSAGPSADPSAGPSPSDCPGSWYGCQGGSCSVVVPEDPIPNKFCDNPCCGGTCCSNAEECSWRCN